MGDANESDSIRQRCLGTALAIVLVENGNDVTMWSHRREAVAEMQQLGVNPKLKDVPLPKELHLSSDLSCVSDSDVVVFATPSFAMRRPLSVPAVWCGRVRFWSVWARASKKALTCA